MGEVIFTFTSIEELEKITLNFKQLLQEKNNEIWMD